MPLYSYLCRCGFQREDIRCVAERHDAPQCDRCKSLMTLQVDPVRGFVRNPAVPRSKR